MRASVPRRALTLPLLSLVVGVALIYVGFLPPVVIAPDERSMLAVSVSALDGHITVPAQMGSPGPDGRVYSRWYPLNSALALPFVAVGRAIANLMKLPVIYVTAPFAILLTILNASFATALVMLLAVRMGASSRAAFLAALTFAFGTVMLLYGRTFFADPLLAALTALAGWTALGNDRRSTAVEFAAGTLAVLAKPTGIVVGGVGAIFHLWRREWSRALACASGTATGLVLYGGYNFVRFGNPLTFGPKWDGFTLCCVREAAVGLLVSPGRGLVWYCPVAIIGLIGAVREARQGRPGGALVLGTFAAYFALHAVWGQWQGGWSWGPRLLVPVLPGLAAAAALGSRPWRRLLIAAALVGLVVNAPTLAWSFERYLAVAYERGVGEAPLIWSWADAPLTNAWPSAVAQYQQAAASDVGAVLNLAGTDDVAASKAEVFRVVPLWWWMLPLVGVPRAAGAVVSLMLIGAGLMAFVRGWRVLPVEAVASPPVGHSYAPQAL